MGIFPAITFIRANPDDELVRTVGATRLWSADVFVGRGLMDRKPSDSKKPGTSHRQPQLEILSASERKALCRIGELPKRGGATLQAAEEGFFNLWKVDENDIEENKNVVLLNYSVTAEKSSHVYFDIGSDDGIALLQGENVIYARRGLSEFSDASDVVEVAVHPGANSFQLILQRDDRRTTRYFAPQWIVKIRVFRNKAAALHCHDTYNRHLMVEPIARSPGDLRSVLVAPLSTHISLRTLDGRQVYDGTIDECGHIHWQSGSETLSGCYIVANDLGQAEPIVLTAGKSLARTAEGVLPQVRSRDEVAKAWARRWSTILISEQTDQQDRKWQQRACLALLGQLNPTQTYATENPEMRLCELHSFRSQLDGSSQEYLCYIPRRLRRGIRGPKPQKAAVLVVLPCQAYPLKPFLESYVLDGNQERECWASVADKYGFILVWPGYVDVDFGGPIARAEIVENLAAFARDYSRFCSDLNILGVCSSGLAATRLPDEVRNDVTGIALYSPMLHKTSHRWFPGMRVRSPAQIPPSALENCNATTIARRNSKQRLVILFDSAMPGHGQRAETDELIAACREMRVDLAVENTGFSDEFAWGVRMQYRLGLIMTALRQSRRPPETSKSKWERIAALRPRESAPSIQAALLTGFSISPTTSDPAHRWLEKWNEIYQRWRGVPLPTGRDRSSVVVTAASLADDRPWVDEVRSELPAHWTGEFKNLFGVARLSAAKDRIAVFWSPDITDELPDYDPLIDGIHSGVLFRREEGIWTQVCAW
jgi:hypothetical protein